MRRARIVAAIVGAIVGAGPLVPAHGGAWPGPYVPGVRLDVSQVVAR